jgi:hypothetical protein
VRRWKEQQQQFVVRCFAVIPAEAGIQIDLNFWISGSRGITIEIFSEFQSQKLAERADDV